jgi:hypothetical protein
MITRRTILGMMLSIMPVAFVVSVIPPMGAISPAHRFILLWYRRSKNEQIR